MNRKSRIVAIVSCSLLAVAVALRAQPAATAPDDPLGPPPEYAIRFTPDMAREFGKVLAKQMVLQRYEVPEDRKPEVAEMMAQRLMEMAHKSGPAAQSFVENMVAQGMEMESRRLAGGTPDMSPEMGKRFGPQLLEMIPHLREFFRGVGQDLRHVLPIKQQFKLAGDMLQIGTAMDAFEKTAQRWSKGEVSFMEDPFVDQSAPPKLEADGQSAELKKARERAERNLQQSEALAEWERYLRQACELYGFDEAQTASAESLLRESKSLVQDRIRDERWREQAYRNRLWAEMLNRMHVAWHHPLRVTLNLEYEQISDPILDIGNRFKEQVDAIPTASQRDAAQQRIMNALAEKGFEPK